MSVVTSPAIENDGQKQSVDFVTFGMFIIDEIEFPPPKPPVHDALGGAGAFAALGARIMSPAPKYNKTVAWIVDKGHDFPESLQETIDSWESAVLYRQDDSRLTTRGWNGYGEAEHRAFKYLTPKKRLTGEDLTPEMVMSKSFHMVCSAARCRQLVSEVNKMRKDLSPDGTWSPPVFVWEPVPDLCTDTELLDCIQTLSYVDVCSPNHAELAAYFGGNGLDINGDISEAQVEKNSAAFLAMAPNSGCSIVVRAGHKGCYITENPSQKTPNVRLSTWIPAYHTDAAKVVDPTGGGNTFLGGLAVGLARGHTLTEAALWGSVAASYAIEQIGVPSISQNSSGNELWNLTSAQERLQELRVRAKV